MLSGACAISSSDCCAGACAREAGSDASLSASASLRVLPVWRERVLAGSSLKPPGDG